MDPALHLTFQYPGFFQHLQVLGNGGLGGAQMAAEFAGAASLARLCLPKIPSQWRSLKSTTYTNCGTRTELWEPWMGVVDELPEDKKRLGAAHEAPGRCRPSEKEKPSR